MICFVATVSARLLPDTPGEVPGESRKVGDMGNVIVGDNGTGFYSERTNELIYLDVRHTFRESSQSSTRVSDPAFVVTVISPRRERSL